MNVDELAAREEILMREGGTHKAWEDVFKEYVTLARESGDMEALKRAVFLIWYDVAEPSDLTGLWIADRAAICETRQMLDDLAERFLMSAFHGGKLKTMKAHYVNDDGDIRIIRPLVYVRERQLADFAESTKLPVIMENCPACFNKPTQRQHMKELLAKEEDANHSLFTTLLSTMRPIMKKDLNN